MLYFFQQVLNGTHVAALYALLAFGYALTNGVLHRTNLAYGALFAFSGQTMILVAVLATRKVFSVQVHEVVSKKIYSTTVLVATSF